MSTTVRLKRGNTSQCDAYIAQPGEPFVDTQARRLRIGDGATSGGSIVLDVVIAPDGIIYARTAKDPGRVIAFEVPIEDPR